ncbi:hypothetical protein BJX76DRAFT_229761 [Aspergillus varians]
MSPITYLAYASHPCLLVLLLFFSYFSLFVPWRAKTPGRLSTYTASFLTVELGERIRTSYLGQGWIYSDCRDFRSSYTAICKPYLLLIHWWLFSVLVAFRSSNYQYPRDFHQYSQPADFAFLNHLCLNIPTLGAHFLAVAPKQHTSAADSPSYIPQRV